MTGAQPPRRAGEDAEETEIDDEAAADLDDGLEVEEIEDDIEDADELEEETGIDLTDASELDADNVPADEEFDRVRQAED